MSISSVTRNHLPGMVLTQADIDAQLAEIPKDDPKPTLDAEGSGYQDNAAAADDTIDPGDTGSDMEAAGRLDGYANEFLNLLDLLAALLDTEIAQKSPLVIESTVHLFDRPESAQAFLLREIEDFRSFAGKDLEDISLEEFQEFPTPDLGDNAAAGLLKLKLPEIDLRVRAAFVRWRRGSVVAVVVVASIGEKDWSGAAEDLARRMDQRIDGGAGREDNRRAHRAYFHPNRWTRWT